MRAKNLTKLVNQSACPAAGNRKKRIPSSRFHGHTFAKRPTNSLLDSRLLRGQQLAALGKDNETITKDAAL
jgi:hypothetical protein